MSERVSVSVEVLNNVLSVLAQLPYSQVKNTIEGLQQDVQQIKTEQLTPQEDE